MTLIDNQSNEDDKISNPLQVVFINGTITVALIILMKAVGIGWVPTMLFGPMIGAMISIGAICLAVHLNTKTSTQRMYAE